MQAIKNYVDNLATLGRKMDHENTIDQVLFGLDSDLDNIKESINGCDNPISFEELHEKLINNELSLKQNQPTRDENHPITTFPLQNKYNSYYPKVVLDGRKQRERKGRDWRNDGSLVWITKLKGRDIEGLDKGFLLSVNLFKDGKI